MKTISSVIFLSFLVLILLVTPVIGSDWIEYDRDKDGNVWSYLKVNSKKEVGKYMVQVCEKEVYSDIGREKQIQLRSSFGLSTEGWDKLSYDLYFSKIDCKKRRKILLSTITYNANDEQLYNVSIDKSKWRHAIPDSKDEKLLKKVCE